MMVAPKAHMFRAAHQGRSQKFIKEGAARAERTEILQTGNHTYQLTHRKTEVDNYCAGIY